MVVCVWMTTPWVDGFIETIEGGQQSRAVKSVEDDAATSSSIVAVLILVRFCGWLFPHPLQRRNLALSFRRLVSFSLPLVHRFRSHWRKPLGRPRFPGAFARLAPLRSSWMRTRENSPTNSIPLLCSSEPRYLYGQVLRTLCWETKGHDLRQLTFDVTFTQCPSVC